ncbi:unnamed protein product [Cuscuta epithymum]|uniref:Uncharacterized protein n=1 Tax=Cuscuta epithymum TaxID=186058 RepID=A0AAV0GA12_9ASTE|nr:unnamed protein product [Cuscuta epithymum]
MHPRVGDALRVSRTPMIRDPRENHSINQKSDCVSLENLHINDFIIFSNTTKVRFSTTDNFPFKEMGT